MENPNTNESKRIRRSITKLFHGIYVENESDKQKIISKFEDKNLKNFAKKVVEQNNNIALTVAANYSHQTDTSEAMMNEIISVDQNLEKIKLYPSLPTGSSSSTEDVIIQRLSKKIADMKTTQLKNTAYCTKCEEEISKIDKKINNDEDYLRKWIGEKKVWLDDVDEFKLKDLTFNNNFSDDPHRTYEFKVMKLICEGILLEKIQDKIDEDIREKNEDWVNVIQEEMKIDADYRDRLSKKLETARNEIERKNIMLLEEEEREKFIGPIQNTKRQILNDWKSYFDAIWDFEPITKENYDLPFTHQFAGHQEKKYKNYLEKTKYWTFEQFKKSVFDAWHFKNLFLAAEDFILTEKIKENFLELAIKLRNKKDEEKRIAAIKDAMDRGLPIPKDENKSLNPNELTNEQTDEMVYSFLMEMLKNIQARAELRTIHPSERKALVDRIVDEKLSFDEALLKTNEIRRTEKKSLVKRISVRDFDVFNPLMKSFINLLFLSMGNKRIKMFKTNKKEIKDKIKLKQVQNQQIDGQVKLLEEIKIDFGKGDSATNLIDVKGENDPLYRANIAALEEINKSIEKLKRLKNEVDTNYNSLISSVSKNLIRPENLNNES